MNCRVNKFCLEKVEKYFNKGYSYKTLTELLKRKYNNVSNVSLRTLSRILNDNQLKRRNINESSLEEILVAVIMELEGSGYNLGYRAMCQRIKKLYKLKVKQKTIMKILKLIDPEGVEGRSRYKLKRRSYSVPGPNFLWHSDGHDKLKRFGFAIYGFMDGYSRKVLSLEVSSTNNKPEVILHYYLKLIDKLGYLPTIIRTDHGTEVTLMEDCHKALRYMHEDEYAGEKSFLKGRSTHNQRIESYWRQFRQHMGDFYIDLFKELENDNLLNISNSVHIECLRFCFGDLIREDILATRKEWNEHRVRKQNCRNVVGGIPNEMFHFPEQFGAVDQRKSLNKDHVRILQNDYSSEPSLVSLEFKELVNFLLDSPKPSTASDAYDLYLNIIDIITKNV